MFFRKKKKIEQLITQGQLDQSYWGIVKRRFRQNRTAVWSLRLLFIIVLIALFSDFIANEKPIYCKIDGQTHFPILYQYSVDLGINTWEAKFFNNSWYEHEYESIILAPIPYSSTTIDSKNVNYTGPFDDQDVPSKRYWHWLGTDNLGRDVAAGMIAGTRTAMLVGIIAMSIASIIGIFFGTIAGYYGDEHFRMSIIRIVLNGIGFLIALFYGFVVRAYQLFEIEAFGLELIKSVGIFLLIMITVNLLSRLLEKIPLFQTKRVIPIDLIIMRIIEVLNSIPGLLLILAIIAAISKPSIIHVMVIIGFISWTTIARFIRAELLRIRSLEYIEAAQAMGFTNFRIMWRHAIPNALTPVLITIAFGIASAILLEAFLSFLGIGVPIEQVTWGSLLEAARHKASAWWLAIFPGFAIFITVSLFNLLGEGLTDAINSNQKS